MAKKNQSDSQNAQTPFENLGELIASKEARTLVVVDHLEKEARVVSGMDEKKPDNPFSYVAPKPENKAAFLN
ncbi:hypothetical protein [Alistipes indistinctus]|uniref:Uncharacterized protein n=1 Tax=Alistipes indistinctus YIT 12060 TaxID=742725 RepID=G5HBD5_9BACT|nr:hypothetical protein [Alistipes indistinctus]EHB91901.1 hypothetical protein HMPREF9450_01950 [Alistipes indistinctus YIT 12060]MBD9134124.1 hypothetical protein [Alistipes indistinctus]UWN59650.1 hypothetical protein NQ495_01475 [Alistipes indistinctus YIT 12060]